MSILDSLLAAMESAGYKPAENGGIEAELKAYAAGLEPVETQAAQFLDSVFIETADDEGLYRYESLLGPEKPNTTVEVRREMLLHRGSITPDDLSLAVLQAHLPAAGVRGTIQEFSQGGVTVVVQELLGVTTEQALFLLSSYLPAHLPIHLDTSLLSD